jgi:hypothetical protein
MRQGGVRMVFNGNSNVHPSGKQSFGQTTGPGEQIDGNRDATKVSHMPRSSSKETLE